MEFPSPVEAKYYSFTETKTGYYSSSYDADPKSWKLQGSNDGKLWIDLDERKDRILSTNELAVFKIMDSNIGSYKCYKVIVTDTNSTHTSYASVGEFQLYASEGNVNKPPVLNEIESKVVNEGAILEFTVSAIDPDGDVLSYTASNIPSGATFDFRTNKFSWIPDYTQAGIYTIHIEASDGSLANSKDVTLTVINVNRPPILDPIGNKTVDEGELLGFTVSAADPDTDPLTYLISDLPAGAVFDSKTLTFSWIPEYTQEGTYTIHFEASDGMLTDSEDITITVNNVNRPPVLDPIGNKTVDEGKLLNFEVRAIDPDGNSVTCTAGNLPAGAIFDSLTGKFSWIPEYTQEGTYTIHFEASDGVLTDSEDITITVYNVTANTVISGIEEYITGLNLTKAAEGKLYASLDNAIKSIQQGNTGAATNQVEAAINKIEAMRNKELTNEQADILIIKMNEIIYVISL